MPLKHGVFVAIVLVMLFQFELYHMMLLLLMAYENTSMQFTKMVGCLAWLLVFTLEVRNDSHKLN